MMPDPLDVAFAAFGNNQAANLLSDDIATYNYAPDLHMMRVLVDAHGDDFWNENLYNMWLGALRMLSPETGTGGTASITPPSRLFRTEPWGRRILNAQLGSWAELRHDTLLYAKQSYTGIPSCEYPDAYVDPYPAFFEAVTHFAEKGATVATLIETADKYLAGRIDEYYTKLGATTTILAEMAQKQQIGEPFTAAELGFINDAVYVGEEDVECAMIDAPYGWYADLFFNAEELLPFERDPTIADVHTQPADEGGTIVGRILHVAVGEPRMMVVSVDTCDGPRAYVGPVFSYYETITEDFERLTDEVWSETLATSKPTDVTWMAPVIAP
jgi:hypothetical protein